MFRPVFRCASLVRRDHRAGEGVMPLEQHIVFGFWTR